MSSDPGLNAAELTDSLQREAVSDLTTTRLSLYLRCLNTLSAEGARTISSQELATRFDLNSAQIRKDLAHFGELGIRGVGYDVERLRSHIRSTLGLDRVRNVAIVGAGHLGMALADYRGFNDDGFRTVALLDVDTAKIGNTSRSGLSVEHLNHLAVIVRDRKVEIGVIAVPAEVAQQTCDQLASVGVAGILNFAPVRLKEQAGMKIRNVDLRMSLETLSFYLTQKSAAGEAAGDSGEPL